MQVYGVTDDGQVVEGSTVTAYVDGVLAGEATATIDGWVIDIESGVDGSEVRFVLDRRVASEMVTYASYDSVRVTLTVPPVQPMQVYGVTGAGSISEGAVVEAFIDDDSVGTDTATADGWVIDIQDGLNGDEVTFTVNNRLAPQTVSYFGWASEQVTLTVPQNPMQVYGKADSGDVIEGSVIEALSGSGLWDRPRRRLTAG